LPAGPAGNPRSNNSNFRYNSTNTGIIILVMISVFEDPDRTRAAGQPADSRYINILLCLMPLSRQTQGHSSPQGHKLHQYPISHRQKQKPSSSTAPGVQLAIEKLFCSFQAFANGLVHRPIRILARFSAVQHGLAPAALPQFAVSQRIRRDPAPRACPDSAGRAAITSRARAHVHARGSTA
jgi:hypothetical protein